MAGSSCEGEQLKGDAEERTITGTLLSKSVRSFSDNVENSDGSEENMAQDTTDAMV